MDAIDYNVYDKNRIPLRRGDVVKVFHYIERKRRERRFMYKWVGTVRKAKDGSRWLKLWHLNNRREWYEEWLNGRVLDDYEIVQGYHGVTTPGLDYRDRPRKPKPQPEPEIHYKPKRVEKFIRPRFTGIK